MKLLEFLQKSGCEANLAGLMGRAIPSAIRKIREIIGGQNAELAGSSNVYGEKQLALDVQANKIILDELKASQSVHAVASEEMEGSIIFKTGADFSVAFDPLDGSSLVDVNFAVGSIFSVYAGGSFIGKTGDEQIAAGFAVYGPHTTFVMTCKKGTHEFRLGDDGEFYLTKENLRIAEDAKHFAPGNLRAASERADYLALTNEWIKQSLTLRYSGGMVPDINHILLKGNGVFTYPGYSKAPEGKLRLLFECNPMALLVEQALGAASDGKDRILAKKITELHQRTPIYIGSKKEVERVRMALNS